MGEWFGGVVDDLAAEAAELVHPRDVARVEQWLAGPQAKAALQRAGDKVALAARAVQGVRVPPVAVPPLPRINPPTFLYGAMVDVLADYPTLVTRELDAALRRQRAVVERRERQAAFLLFGIHL